MEENGLKFSFEVFPPKKDGEFYRVYEILKELSELSPEFISVTYGAGGSRSKRTIEIASYIQNELHIRAIAHLTCVGNTRAQIRSLCSQMEGNRISHVLALRGDRPKDMSDEQYEIREFSHASDLMQFIKENTKLHMTAACYPEKHYEAPDMESDLLHMREKQDLGAEFFISQLFFENQVFYDFMERADRAGIHVPIHAGIMPITSAKQIGTSVTLSGASISRELEVILEKYGEKPEDMYLAGIDYAVRQIQDLKEHGMKEIHLYTMNKPDVAKKIVGEFFQVKVDKI